MARCAASRTGSAACTDEASTRSDNEARTARMQPPKNSPGKIGCGSLAGNARDLAPRSRIGDKRPTFTETIMGSIDRRLHELGLTLPSPAAPVANYVPFVRTGNLVVISGQLCFGPEGMNGASDLMVEVFGDKGRHARSTIGVAELPADAAVEVEAMFEVA